MRIKSLFIILLSMALIQSCTDSQKEFVPNLSEDILINQVGYPTGSNKQALLRKEVETFELRDTTGAVVYKGATANRRYWELSGDTVSVADFSDFTRAGEYMLCINDDECSYPFRIGESLYDELADAALKSYYYARCGFAIEEAFGGQWNRAAGHPDTSVLVHASAADKIRAEGTAISSPGGWYDAGDYGKYIVNSSITTWTILQSLALNSEYHENQNLNIPESGNELPDVLDEALVNLQWMMTMQDPNDGGLYHKLTTKGFDDFIMPHEAYKQRYVMQKSTAAALDYAATISAGARVVGQHGLDDLAQEMEASALKAWDWAIKNPAQFYLQPEDISTGAYPDTSYLDERFWASAELYVLTGEPRFKEALEDNYQLPITPKWDVVQTLGVISLLTSDKREEFKSMEDDYLAYVDGMLQKEQLSPYLISMDQFAWGSNSDVANDGMLKLVANQLSPDRRYVASAQNDLHYILGRNATGYSFVTGFGAKTPQAPHNRIIAMDGINAPIPGYIVGGPNTIVLTDCAPDSVWRSNYPAASYTDTQCSYSTNETAINWNAPLVFLATGLSQNENVN
ncbi:MAG: glycoside hydrolase family 9 protein [Cyclobacteriaceae bacterium]